MEVQQKVYDKATEVRKFLALRKIVGIVSRADIVSAIALGTHVALPTPIYDMSDRPTVINNYLPTRSPTRNEPLAVITWKDPSA